MEEIIIKYTTQKEIEEVLESFKNDLSSLKQGAEYRKKMVSKFYHNATVIGIENEDNIKLGFAALYCNNSERKTAYLSMIAVNDYFRGKGIGKKLLRIIEEIALDNGMFFLQLEVSKTNKNAISFYKKNKYVSLEERQDSWIYTKNLR